MKSILYTIPLLCCIFLLSFTTNNSSSTVSVSSDEECVPETQAKKIKWLTIDEALRLSQTRPKKLFIDVYTDWCIVCTKMEHSTLTDEGIVDYINDKFYPVKLDAEMKKSITYEGKVFNFDPSVGENGVHEIVLYLTRGRPSFPTVVFIDEYKDNPQPIRGFINKEKMEKLSRYFGDNYYKQYEWPIFDKMYKSPAPKVKESIGSPQKNATSPKSTRKRRMSNK